MRPSSTRWTEDPICGSNQPPRFEKDPRQMMVQSSLTMKITNVVDLDVDLLKKKESVACTP
jgi:hypothetical protein